MFRYDIHVRFFRQLDGEKKIITPFWIVGILYSFVTAHFELFLLFMRMFLKYLYLAEYIHNPGDMTCTESLSIYS